ncbi:MAG TPA: hypothetical protein VM532_03290 [Burkholderiales bacterium]|nr:hypothetical protein [Burkholderiales bacterium]
MSCIDDVYQQFTYVGHTVQPSAPSALTLAEATFFLTVLVESEDPATLSRPLHTPPLPAAHGPVGYC